MNFAASLVAAAVASTAVALNTKPAHSMDYWVPDIAPMGGQLFQPTYAAPQTTVYELCQLGAQLNAQGKSAAPSLIQAAHNTGMYNSMRNTVIQMSRQCPHVW